MEEHEVKNGQSLLDLSIETMGSVEHVFLLADVNNLSVTEVLPAGTKIVYLNNNSRTAALYRANGWRPATINDR